MWYPYPDESSLYYSPTKCYFHKSTFNSYSLPSHFGEISSSNFSSTPNVPLDFGTLNESCKTYVLLTSCFLIFWLMPFVIDKFSPSTEINIIIAVKKIQKNTLSEKNTKNLSPSPTLPLSTPIFSNLSLNALLHPPLNTSHSTPFLNNLHYPILNTTSLFLPTSLTSLPPSQHLLSLHTSSI